MINKQFDQIEKSDIDGLIELQVRESRSVEYKESLPGNSDDDKREFLADISAFANGAGGDLFYGIKEKRGDDGKTTGFPDAVHGISSSGLDGEVRRLESMIRDGIEPRIPNIRMRPIEGFPNGVVLLVRVPKSWMAPHMITFKNLSRFYSRNSAGKYPLDVTEIRAAFAASDGLLERIRRFRDERLARIVADETPAVLKAGPKLVIHMLPIGSLDRQNPVDPVEVGRMERGLLMPLESGGCRLRYNADGCLTYGMDSEAKQCESYLQVFRTGTLEAVCASLYWQDGDKLVFHARELEGEIVPALRRYLKLLQLLDQSPPIFLQICLVGVLGYRITHQDAYAGRRLSEVIDRDLLILPDVLINEYTDDAARVIRPALDTMWQAAGLAGSPGYDTEGNWRAG